MTENVLSSGHAEILSAFGNSFAVDRRLFSHEIRASLAHADALFRAGILTRLEAERIKNGLWTIHKRAEIDRHYFDSLPSPDVFAFVEARLFQLINEAASMLQQGRTRPHRAAVALRLWLREQIGKIIELLENLQDALGSLAANKTDLKANLFAAFFEMFADDEERFVEVARRVNRMPSLNFAETNALAEFDFAETAHQLGFDGVLPNALESILDRDFCFDFVHCASSAMLHLARLSNELLTYSSALRAETTEVLEILRSRSGRVFGKQTALLTILQNAPLRVTRELQEINEIVFDADELVSRSLSAATAVLRQFPATSDFPR